MSRISYSVFGTTIALPVGERISAGGIMDQVRSLTQAYSQAPWRNKCSGSACFALPGIHAGGGHLPEVLLLVQQRLDEILLMQVRSSGCASKTLTLRHGWLLNSSTVMEDRALALGFQPIQETRPCSWLCQGMSSQITSH
jgi:hypothetical protein